MEFAIEYAKSGRSTCKESKEKIQAGELRIAKITTMPRGDEEITMQAWHKVVPFFTMMGRMRKKENQLRSVDDLAGFDEINEEDQDKITQYLADFHDPDVDFPPKKEKAAKKRKTDDEGPNGGEEEAAIQSPEKKKKKKKLPDIEEETKEVQQSELRAVALEMAQRCRDRGLEIPEDDDVARKKFGGLVMAHRSGTTLDVAALIREADKQFGMKVHVENVQCDANEGLADAFKALSNFEFANGDRMKGIAYQKVATTIAGETSPITDGKSASKLPAIGKASAAKIDEFLQNGTISKLEEYKNAV